MAGSVSKLRSGEPQGAAALKQLTASTDLFEAIDTELVRYRLRVDDVAVAYAVWWVTVDADDTHLFTPFENPQSGRRLTLLISREDWKL